MKQSVPLTSVDYQTFLKSTRRINLLRTGDGGRETVARDLPHIVRVLSEDKQLLVGFGACRPGRVKRDGSSRVGTREGPVWSHLDDFGDGEFDVQLSGPRGGRLPHGCLANYRWAEGPHKDDIL